MLLAFRLALASPFIRADLVEATEFPQLANHYGVSGVPHSVINESTHVEGAVPEDVFVEKMLQALQPRNGGSP